MADLTPTYIARCPECLGMIGVSVADPDHNSIEWAVKDRKAWLKVGYDVKTGTVQDVRDMKGPLGHADDCAFRGRKRKKSAALTG